MKDLMAKRGVTHLDHIPFSTFDMARVALFKGLEADGCLVVQEVDLARFSTVDPRLGFFHVLDQVLIGLKSVMGNQLGVFAVWNKLIIGFDISDDAIELLFRVSIRS